MATYAYISTGLWVDALMPWLDDLAAHLATQGVGTVGTDVFKNRAPDTPAACVTLREYGGASPDFVHDKNSPSVESLRFQVRCRSTSDPLAYQKAQDVAAAFESLIATTVISGTTYLQVIPLQSPFPMELDGRNRTTYVQNYQVRK